MTKKISKPRVSFEFFPPKTEAGLAKLWREQDKLAALKPDFFSVTYGAGGSTRDRTQEIVRRMGERTDICTAPHLSCLGETRDALSALVLSYQEQGVDRLVALRGDAPSGFGHSQGGLVFAKDLVALIRELSGDHFFIEVAAYPEMHPQAENMAKDLGHFKEKVQAGANSAITQYFYNADAYEHFLECCAKHQIHIPIVAGVMPITNYVKLARFSDMCGAQIPRWIEKQLHAFGKDHVSLVQFGEEVVSRIVERLIQLGAPGVHFYTLNQADPSIAICKNLDLV